jgi:Dehydrogenase E1 component
LQIFGLGTYRVGHHSTSDDSFAYRARQEVEDRKRIDNPIARYRLFLQNRGWWSDAEEDELKESLKKDVMRAFKHAESLKRHELKEVFSDVYGGEEPLNLVGVPRSPPSPASSILPQTKILTLPHVLIERTTGGAYSTPQKIRDRVGTVESRDEEVQG